MIKAAPETKIEDYDGDTKTNDRHTKKRKVDDTATKRTKDTKKKLKASLKNDVKREVAEDQTITSDDLKIHSHREAEKKHRHSSQITTIPVRLNQKELLKAKGNGSASKAFTRVDESKWANKEGAFDNGYWAMKNADK